MLSPVGVVAMVSLWPLAAVGADGPCGGDQFYCGRNATRSRCVPLQYKCDNDNDCGNMADEEGCECPAGLDFDCGSTATSWRRCIDNTTVCNRRNDCGNWADEAGCECPEGSVPCAREPRDRYACGWRCDGLQQCLDAADEANCTEIVCRGDTFLCGGDNATRSTCLPKTDLCDMTNDCGNWFDESNCACPSGHFQCDKTAGGSVLQCLPDNHRCDGVQHCLDGQDEADCEEITCRENMRMCEGANVTQKCIFESDLCDHHNDCGNWDDEKDCTCPEGQLLCDRNHGRVSFVRRRGKRQAPGGQGKGRGKSRGVSFDAEDEPVEDHSVYSRREVLAASSRTSRDRYGGVLGANGLWGVRYQGRHENPHGDWHCVPESLRCDGVDDCAQGEDEADCPVVNCRYGLQSCGEGGNVSCVDRYHRCDMVNDCGNWADEANCECENHYVPAFDCGSGESVAESELRRFRRCIPQQRRCDGVRDCPGGRDEAQCEEITCRWNMERCGSESQLCVEREKLCDSHNDCGGWEDEANCTCPAEHFDCGFGVEVNRTRAEPWTRREAAARCIDASLRCDGTAQCANGNDERHCPPLVAPFGLAESCGRLESAPVEDGSVPPGQWPWLVSIRLIGEDANTEHICGAAVLAPDTLLTSLLCLVRMEDMMQGPPPGQVPLRSVTHLRVHAHSHSTGQVQEEEQVVGVSSIEQVKAEGHMRGPEAIMTLAVIRLRGVVGSKTDAICLPQLPVEGEEEEDFDDCWVAGWSRPNHYGAVHATPVQAKVAVDVDCGGALPPPMRASKICGHSNRALVGEVGGPLMCRSADSGRWRVAGVAYPPSATTRGISGACAENLTLAFESVRNELHFVVRAMNSSLYHGPLQQPLLAMAEAEGVGFRTRCEGESEVFDVCLAPDGSPLIVSINKVGVNETIRMGDFEYNCFSVVTAQFGRRGALVAGFRVTSCVVPGSPPRSEPAGTEFGSPDGHFRLRCEETLHHVPEYTAASAIHGYAFHDQGFWMRTVVVGCRNPVSNETVADGDVIQLQADGKSLSLRCSIGYQGMSGALVEADGDQEVFNVRGFFSLRSALFSTMVRLPAQEGEEIGEPFR